MEGLASLLKLLFEKGSWLAGVALVGIATAGLRWLDFFDDANKDAVYLLYLVSAICASVYVSGGIAAVVERRRKKRKETSKRAELRKKAVENFPTLPPEYQRTLVWMYVFDRRTVSVDGESGILDTLAYQGYLERDFPDEYHVIKTYNVPDEIWALLQRVDKLELKRHFRENEPPWIGSGRI